MVTKNDHINIQLISLVEQYPEIYDKTHKDYRGSKEEVWINISSRLLALDLDCSSRDCAERWIALRNRFSKERCKIQKRQLRLTEAVGNNSWSLYQNLLFLNEHVAKRRQTLSNTNEMVSSVDDENCEIVFDDNTEDLYSSPDVTLTSPERKRSKTETNKLSEQENFKYDIQNIETDDRDVDIKSFCNAIYHELIKVPNKERLECKIEEVEKYFFEPWNQIY